MTATDHVHRPMSAGRRGVPRRGRRLAAAALTSALLAGCSGGTGALDMTAKRENLDLLYKKAELAKQPPTLQEITETAPFVPGLDAGVLPDAWPSSGSTMPGPSPVAGTSCRTAPANAPATSQTTTRANGGPAVGAYGAHQTGTFGITAGTFSYRGLVAPQLQVRIANVDDRSSVDSTGTTVTNVTFDEIVPGLAAPTITTYRVTSTELQLVKIVSGDYSFEPSPSVTIMQFRDAAGSSWSAAGVDLDSTETMTVQGRIESRSKVDLCGTVVEAYRVSSVERRVNPQTQYSYETDEEQPKIYEIATQLGALTIRIREKSTTSFVSDGTPVTVTVDYVRTFDGPSPVSAR